MYRRVVSVMGALILIAALPGTTVARGGPVQTYHGTFSHYDGLACQVGGYATDVRGHWNVVLHADDTATVTVEIRDPMWSTIAWGGAYVAPASAVENPGRPWTVTSQGASGFTLAMLDLRRPDWGAGADLKFELDDGVATFSLTGDAIGCDGTWAFYTGALTGR